jgi:hypothetical protein
MRVERMKCGKLGGYISDFAMDRERKEGWILY